MATTPTPPTILTLKQSFLTAQTRILSQPLAPSRAWQRANAQSPDRLPAAAVEDALTKANHKLQQHNRRAYPAQATRHVAEQLDELLLSSSSSSAATTYPVLSSADLTDAAVIAALPASAAAGEEDEDEEQTPETRRYGELVAALQAASARRNDATARVARLRRLRALLAGFADVGGLQGNLVTRDGEVERELERMRVLLARVGDRVERLDGGRDDEINSLFRDGEGMVVDDVEVEERRKVGELLERF